MTFYLLYFIIQQWSREHFNLLILSSCNFNNYVTLAKNKIETLWRWRRCIEKCRSAYDIENIVNIYVVHLLIWVIKCTFLFYVLTNLVQVCVFAIVGSIVIYTYREKEKFRYEIIFKSSYKLFVVLTHSLP